MIRRGVSVVKRVPVELDNVLNQFRIKYNKQHKSNHARWFTDRVFAQTVGDRMVNGMVSGKLSFEPKKKKKRPGFDITYDIQI